MRFNQLGRREFITLVGGAAVAWPLPARAQQPDHVRRVGVFMNLAADDPESSVEMAAFVDGLHERGWTLGGNLQIEFAGVPAIQSFITDMPRNWSRLCRT